MVMSFSMILKAVVVKKLVSQGRRAGPPSVFQNQFRVCDGCFFFCCPRGAA